jgi:biopolymer transport protein ExbB
VGHQQVVSWLALAAAVAPLIGLLGTVWGITESFYDTTQLEVGQNRAEALSQGIYVALVTTICGLVIAVPATIAAHFFENRIVTLMNEIEEMGLNMLPQFERYEGKVRLDPRNPSDDAPPTDEFTADFIVPPPGASSRTRHSATIKPSS